MDKVLAWRGRHVLVLFCPPTSVATLGVLTVGVDSRWSHTCAPFLIALLTTAQKLLHLPF